MANIGLGHIWAFMGGLIVSWYFQGAQGENTWWLIVVTIIAFYFMTSRKKREGTTLAEAVKEVVAENAALGKPLDRTAVWVDPLPNGVYRFDFYKDGETFYWDKPIVGGLQGITPRSVESLRREERAARLELRQPEKREDMND